MQYTLTATTVYHHVRFLLQDHLQLTDFSPACTARTLLAVVLAVIARRTSVFAARLRLAAPAAETLPKALLASLPTLRELEDHGNDVRPSLSSPRADPPAAQGGEHVAYLLPLFYNGLKRKQAPVAPRVPSHAI